MVNILWTQQEFVFFSQREVCMIRHVPSAMKKAGLAKNSGGLDVWQADLWQWGKSKILYFWLEKPIYLVFEEKTVHSIENVCQTLEVKKYLKAVWRWQDELQILGSRSLGRAHPRVRKCDVSLVRRQRRFLGWRISPEHHCISLVWNISVEDVKFPFLLKNNE